MKRETIDQINKRVDSNKQWETSWTRKVVIAAITYISALIFLWVIEVPDPYLAALVTTGGFLLSTSTLQPIRILWEKYKT